jgi:predicted GNAT family acetyltransferase
MEGTMAGTVAGDADGMVTLTADARDAAELAPVEVSDAELLTITKNGDAGIYEAALRGETVAGVVYSTTGNHVTLLATSVFPRFRGKGIAAGLLSGVLDELRRQGATVSITCPFGAEFVRTHPEYADILHATAAQTARPRSHRGEART